MEKWGKANGSLARVSRREAWSRGRSGRSFVTSGALAIFNGRSLVCAASHCAGGQSIVMIARIESDSSPQCACPSSSSDSELRSQMLSRLCECFSSSDDTPEAFLR